MSKNRSNHHETSHGFPSPGRSRPATVQVDGHARYGTTMTGVPMTPERVQGPAWSYLDLLHLRQRVEDAGLTLSVIEGYQLSDRITLGQPGRDEDLDRLCESIANMGRAGIPIYCYNFMAVFNWLRTSISVCGRGDALTAIKLRIYPLSAGP